MVADTALSLWDMICSCRNLCDLKYEGDVALLIEDSGTLQVLFHRLNDSVGTVRTCFTPSNSKMLLQDWIGSEPDVVLAGEKLSEVDEFSYLDRCISPGGRVG